jgi:hypothetical protein
VLWLQLLLPTAAMPSLHCLHYSAGLWLAGTVTALLLPLPPLALLQLNPQQAWQMGLRLHSH